MMSLMSSRPVTEKCADGEMDIQLTERAAITPGKEDPAAPLGLGCHAMQYWRHHSPTPRTPLCASRYPSGCTRSALSIRPLGNLT